MLLANLVLLVDLSNRWWLVAWLADDHLPNLVRAA
jgi:hypothetical protein